MKILISVLLIMTSSVVMAESFSFEQLCEGKVKQVVDNANKDDQYSYDKSTVRLLDSMGVR